MAQLSKVARAADPDLYEYLDYRAYLGDVYRTRKASGRAFSYRMFSRRAGLRSPNHLKRVIDGERPLTAKMAPRYAEALGLDPEHTAYFCDLVAFNEAKTASLRAEAYAVLTGHRGYREAQRLDLAHAAYHAHWYLPAIRELAARGDFEADAKWIAKRLVPSIRPAQAKRALEVLFELGLLVETEDGVVPSHEVVTTGAQTAGVHITAYHRAALERASASIDLVPAAERDISSVTIPIGVDGIARLKERVRRFRRELLSLAAQEDEPDRVVQVGIQIFPLTTSRAKEDS